MKRPTLILLGLCLVNASAFAGRGPETAKDDLSQFYIAGPAEVTDAMNGVTLDLPAGWFAAIPRTLPGVPMTGVTTIANYDMAQAENLIPDRSTHTMLPGMVKADLFTLKPEGGKNAAQWATDRNHAIGVGRYAEDGTELEAPAPTTKTIAYRLAGEDGYAYGVANWAFSSVDIVLPWRGGEQIFFANVHQADSEALDRALLVLDTVRPAGARARQMLQGDRASVVEPILALVKAEIPGLKQQSASSVEAACTSWAGSDPGTGISNCPSTLYFPHQYNEFWEAGNAGSFWGNFWHGNCNNDYYAMDHNYRGNGSCGAYGNDIGRNIYAAYSGTAANQAYSSTGYGYHVLVTSSIGGTTYTTLYAHLQAAGYSGAATANVTVVGLAGDSGSAAGAPHLHFGIKQNGSSKCNTNGSNASCPTRCSNCETKASPQTCKPGTMFTKAGSSAMSDGVCYGGPP
jgi:hypothetical protein